MTEDLDRLDVLAAAATPGPWTVFEGYDGGRSLAMLRSTDREVSIIGPEDAEWPWVLTDANAEFIAACDPATIRALVAAVRERDELRAAAEEMFRRAGPICPDCGEVDPHSPDDGTCAALPLRAALHHKDGA